MMKKLFVLLIKYMPTIQLVGMLVNNTLYKYDVNLEFDYIGDFLLGNSIANITILYDKHVRNINREITYWDVYVAVNAQYHDYVRLYQDWFPNLTEEQLDEKVIYSAINFWFKDEDAGTGKVWNYFKEI